jgi:hypothetical protein
MDKVLYGKSREGIGEGRKVERTWGYSKTKKAEGELNYY